MVAEPRRPRAFALLMAIAFLAVSWAPVSLAQTENLPGVDQRLFPILTVERGSVDIKTSNDPPVVVPGEQLKVTLTVRNTGERTADPFPVYAVLHGQTIQAKCKGLALAPGEAKTVDFSFSSLADNLAAGDNLVTVLVNEQWNADWASTEPTCARPQGSSQDVALRDEKLEDPNNERLARHIAWGHFIVHEVIDLQVHDIRWCSGAQSVGSAAGCDEDMLKDNRKWNYNVTGHADDANAPSTFFLVDVQNVGNHTSMKNLGDARCDSFRETVGSAGDPFTPDPETCDDFAYDVQLRISRLDGTQAVTIPMFHEDVMRRSLTNGDAAIAAIREGVPDNATVWVSDSWSLVGQKGDYKVTVNIDPTGTDLTENATINNQLVRDDIQVRTFDLNATFGVGFKTDIGDPYAYAEGVTVSGTVNFTNDGNANATGRPVNISIYVDDGLQPYRDTLDDGILQGQTVSIPYSFTFSTDPADPDYLPRGQHTLHARVDDDHTKFTHYVGWWNETDESNNARSLVFYLADDSAPRFTPSSELDPDEEGNATDNPRIQSDFDDNGDPRLGPTDTVVRPGKLVSFHAYVTEDDANVSVVANVSYDDDPNVTREYVMHRVTQGQSHFAVSVHDFPMHDHENETRGSQNWTLRVVAKDASGNEEVSDEVAFKLVGWDLHSAPEDYFVLGQPQNVTYRWSEANWPHYKVFLLDNVTGIDDQWHTTQNLKLIVDPPGDHLQGQPYTIGPEGWTRVEGATTEEKAACDDAEDTLPIDTGGEEPVPCTVYGQLEASFGYSDPGPYNATIVIRDVAGIERRVNRSFLVLDEPPEFQALKLMNSTNVSINKIASGDKFVVAVDVDDDFDVNASAVHLNLTRTDGQWRNITLSEHEATSDGSRKVYEFNETLPTGRFTQLDLAGTFNVTVQAADVNGNWGKSPNLTLVIEDAVEPTLEAGVRPTEQETSENVTFWARSTDQTNVTVKLVVARDGIEVYNATLDHVKGNEYEHVTNFTRTGRYTWTMVAYDGNVDPLESATRGGSLLISDNLGPRFEVRSPSFSVDGERFSNAAPRLEVVVYDSDGVKGDSIRLEVGGVAIDADAYRLDDPPAGFRGYTIVYDMPQNYEHNDSVIVTLNATDLSNKTLSNEVGFSFRIDDSRPVSRMASFEPRYRELEGHVWNVSLDTEFTISAIDNDGLPTDVESIRFQVIGGGSGTTETIYSGPFKLRDIPDAYTGPRIYLIQFYAEDDVGNRERPANQISVYVDDTPPQFDPFGSLPQGRYVNVTFVDDRSGVERVVAWHKVNDGPYHSLALERDGDVWRGVLPEGRKGDQVSYYLEAWDRVGNSDTTGNESAPHSSYTVGNHLPVVRITSPVLGQRVGGSVDLKWTANDEDNDALAFKVYLKAPGRASFVELATLDATDARSHALDSTKFADGQYVIAVTASDGTFVARAETTVTFINSGRAIEDSGVSRDRVTPEEGVLITARISKAQAVVEARVYRNGQFVEAFAMNDDGKEGDAVANDGTYSVLSSFARSGTYSVEIVSRYQENGEAKEDRMMDAASFTVGLTPGLILSEYWLVWLGLVTLALAAVGVAGFGLYKKWR